MKFLSPWLVLFALLFLGQLGLTMPASAGEDEGVAPRKSVIVPVVDPQRGRRLFVAKGCVICHAVKGVGGQAAPALDAGAEQQNIDLLGFVSRLMRGMPAMAELQAIELGYRVDLAAEDIADLAGFVSDPDLQAAFSLDEVPEPMRDWFLDEPYWNQEDWPEDLPEEYPEVEEGSQL